MDHSAEHHRSYVGKPVSALPTPSFIVSLPIVKKNIARLHQDVDKLGIGFRPHVKTLKVSISPQPLTKFIIAHHVHVGN